ncbi:MAG: cobalamin-dependent protein [Promethearchaeota archaeon]
MKSYDVLFIHPPRLLEPDYRKDAKYIRSSFIFIPMGLFSIADLLEKNGFRVRIINYPLEQFLNRNWTLKDYLKHINFNVCGIDLHWIHNAYGAIEVAGIVKEVNPNAKVVLGGFSASYYHNQILKYYKNIDGVIRGEGEIPFLNYVQTVNKNSSLDSVPNLSYHDSSGHTKINSLSYTAKSLDDLNFTNVSLLRNAKQYFEYSRKIMGISFNLPIGRGCPFDCPFCGGGQRAQQKLTGRKEVILRSPEKVIEDIKNISDKYDIPSIFFGHGAYPANLKYWKRLFNLIKKEKFDIGADLEIWRLPFPKEIWNIFSKTFPRKYSSISISPRIMSPKVHQKIIQICDPTFNFPTSQIRNLIRNANLYQITLRIWLTIGFPFQNRLDVLKDFIFAFKCLLKYGKSKVTPITIMNEPYFVFPGSPAYESPDNFGITLRYESFPEIVEVFKQAKSLFNIMLNCNNHSTKYLSQASIRYVNLLFSLVNIPMLLTSKPPDPKMGNKSSKFAD